MKRFLFIVLLFLLSFGANAAQHFVAEDDCSSVSSFSDSVVYIDSGVTVSAPGNTIEMCKPVYLYNSGHIDGTINTNGNVLVVYNSGTIQFNSSSPVDNTQDEDEEEDDDDEIIENDDEKSTVLDSERI